MRAPCDFRPALLQQQFSNHAPISPGRPETLKARMGAARSLFPAKSTKGECEPLNAGIEKLDLKRSVSYWAFLGEAAHVIIPQCQRAGRSKQIILTIVVLEE
jgi:hypothetical protein